MLVKHLPSIVHLRGSGNDTTPWFQSTLQFIASEVSQNLPGGTAIVDRLAEVLFVQAMRSRIGDSSATARPSWLHALNDPQIGDGPRRAKSNHQDDGDRERGRDERAPFGLRRAGSGGLDLVRRVCHFEASRQCDPFQHAMNKSRLRCFVGDFLARLCGAHLAVWIEASGELNRGLARNSDQAVWTAG